MSLRIPKVNHQIQRLITEVIQKEVDDPNIEFLSITRVDTTADLSEAKIYFSLLDDTKYEKVQQSLDRMSKFIRSRLGKKMRIRILPQLKFIPDDSIKYSVDIYRKIEEVTKDDEERAG